MIAQRWITIGECRRQYIWYGGSWGVPDGLEMRWKGKTSWCQATEFLDYDALFRAVRIRLGVAGLEAVKISILERPEGWWLVRILVKRLVPAPGSRALSPQKHTA